VLKDVPKIYPLDEKNINKYPIDETKIIKYKTPCTFIFLRYPYKISVCVNFIILNEAKKFFFFNLYIYFI